MTSRILHFAVFSFGTLAITAMVLTVMRGALFPAPDVANAVIRPAAGPTGLSFDPNAPILPIIGGAPEIPERVALGRELFNDPGLSNGAGLSCASCHDVASGGDDGVPRSIGRNGTPLARNAPTVFNSAQNVSQFWDGRASTLAEQIDAVVFSKHEFSTSWPALLAVIRSNPAYQEQFHVAYPDGITERAVKDAIVAYERTLVTPGAPFDRFLMGDEDAITPAQKRGYGLFQSMGCASCHQGQNVGGNMFQPVGIFGDLFADRGAESAADLGRFNVTGDPADRNVFRVAPLRNVALTAPYLHDGSVETLEQMVLIMARYQLGRTIASGDVLDIVAFLHSLTGDLP